jgi:hypothetical protein
VQRRLERQLTALDRETQRLLASYRVSALELLELASRHTRIQEKPAHLRQRLAGLPIGVAERLPQEEVTISVEECCRTREDALLHPSFETNQKILRLVVERIEFQDDQMTIKHLIPAGNVRLYRNQFSSEIPRYTHSKPGSGIRRDALQYDGLHRAVVRRPARRGEGRGRARRDDLVAVAEHRPHVGLDIHRQRPCPGGVFAVGHHQREGRRRRRAGRGEVRGHTPVGLNRQIADYEQAQAFREQLNARAAAALRALTLAYQPIFVQLKKQLDALTAQILTAQQNGQTIRAAWLQRQERYRTLLAQVVAQIEKYNLQLTIPLAEQQQRALASLGEAHAGALLQAAHAPAKMGASFTRLPAGAIEQLVGRAGDGTPLGKLLRGYGAARTRKGPAAAATAAA